MSADNAPLSLLPPRRAPLVLSSSSFSFGALDSCHIAAGRRAEVKIPIVARARAREEHVTLPDTETHSRLKRSRHRCCLQAIRSLNFAATYREECAACMCKYAHLPRDIGVRSHREIRISRGRRGSALV